MKSKENKLHNVIEIPDINKRFLDAIDTLNYTGYRLQKEKTGISQVQVSHIKSGRNEPSKDVLESLLDKFPKLNKVWLLTGEGQMFKDQEIAEQSSVKDRLIKFLEFKGISQGEFEKIAELSNGYVNNIRKSISSETFDKKISPKFPELNKYWILYNEGDMINNQSSKQNQIKPSNDKGVPYFDGEVTSTITTSFMDIPAAPTFYINIPPLNDCDAYITNRGDSMFPKYRNGEILGIKRIYNLEVIQWGESHLVITNSNANDMRTVKNVHPHPESDKVILRASNPNNAGDTVVSKEDILEIYIIKANLDITHL